MIERLQRGQQIRIRSTSGGEWVRGVVVLASDTNPSSVGLMLAGVLRSQHGAWVGGGLPLFVDYEAETVKSLIGDEYEIEVAGG